MSTQSKRRPVVVPPFNGQAGKCCWCGSGLKGRRTRWCSTPCVTAYLIAKGDTGRARTELVKRDGHRCAICHEGEKKVLEVDHAIPLVEGGTNAIQNLRLLCRECHRDETRKLRGRMAEKARAAKSSV